MRLFISTLVFILSALLPGHSPGHPHILRVVDDTVIGFEDLLNDLAADRVVFFGEYHDHLGHHNAQLELIRGLHQKGLKVAVGLEMFRRSNQYALDRWVDGQVTEEEFLPIFRANWKMWRGYAEIFRYARDEGIRMIGLNISREITGQVARSGVASLSGEHLEVLGGVSCEISEEYQNYIRTAMGNHADNGTSFKNFCEAQLVWDISMARNLSDFLSENPDTTVVVLAGAVHAWKHGIPAQLQQFVTAPTQVILPEMFGRVDRTTENAAATDYVWLHFGPSGWQVTPESE